MTDKSATFATRSQAKIWAQRMEFKYRQGGYFPKEVKERTFAYLIDRYIENELPQTPKVYLNRPASSFGGKITLDPTFLC